MLSLALQLESEEGEVQKERAMERELASSGCLSKS